MLNATVTAQSRLQTPEQFRNIVVKSDPSGARVLLGDVARVELGAENYSATIRINGHPGAGIGISLAPGAERADAPPKLVKAQGRASSRRSMPAGLSTTPTPTTRRTSSSCRSSEVVKTLLEAIVLVVLVMFVFLQSWRATLIPAIAVPVVLLGTFGDPLHRSASRSTRMTLFGLVLAIGLLVDDAIVVVENVERLMHENPEMTPRDATIASMEQIQMALVAIALVLSAVFLPMAFFGGSTGVIYRQFSVTIVSAMVLSVFVALTLQPGARRERASQRKHATVEETLARTQRSRRRACASSAARRQVQQRLRALRRLVSSRTVSRVVDRKWLFLGIYAGVVARC